MTDPFADLRMAGRPANAHLVRFFLRHRAVIVVPTALALAVVSLSPWPLLLLLSLAVFPMRTTGMSMAPALGNGTFGLLLTWPVRRGDVVVGLFDGLRPLVKRVVAVGGDQLDFTGGTLTVDGQASTTRMPLDLSGTEPIATRTVVVPDGHVFLMGDHVTSIDSRQLGTLPQTQLVGRYLPLLSWGRPERTPLAEADASDVQRIDPDAAAAAGLQRMFDVGGFAPAHLTLALRLALLQSDARPTADAVLERALVRDQDVGERGLWTMLLAQLRLTVGRDAEALSVLDRHLKRGVPTAHDATLRAYRATALSRLERYSEALEQADEVEERWPELGFSGARIAALVGLGRLDAARARIDELTAAEAWGLAVWEPWYRSYVEVAEGRLDEATELVIEAIEHGMDRRLVGATPLLQPLRDSPQWGLVEAALSAPTRQGR